MTALELNSRVDNFVANWTGVKNGYFIVYTGQCVQIVNQYNQDVVNAPFMPTPVTMGARDVFEYWRQILLHIVPRLMFVERQLWMLMLSTLYQLFTT